MFKQKKLSLGARFGLCVASFVLGILLFVSAIATMLIADVQIVTSKDGVNGLVRELFISSAPARPKAPVTAPVRTAPRPGRTYQMPRREEPEGVASNLTDQLIEMFYEEMQEMFGEEITFTQEEFVEMINDSTVIDYIADKTAGLITDFWNDEVTTTFEAEEVVQLINENAALIESITGQPLPDDIAQQVAKVFDENEIIVVLEREGLAGFMKLTENTGPDNNLESESAAGGVSMIDIREAINTIQQYTSPTVLAVCIATCLVLIAAIILINCHQLGRGLRRAGYPLMWAGSMVILNILAKYQPDMWVIVANEGETVAQSANLALKLAQHVLLQTTGVHAAIFCTGLVLCIVGIVLPIVLRTKNDAVVTVPTTPETDELVEAIAEEEPVEILPESVEEPEEIPAEEEVEEEPTPITE